MKFLAFEVLGVPAPKGSSRAMMRGGRAVNVPSGSDVNKDKLMNWGNAVRVAAAHAIQSHSHCVQGAVYFGAVPLRIQIVFRMRRLKAHYKTNGELKPDAPKYHQVKPDLGKLLRATEDSLIGIVVLDDALFAEALIRKVYADPGREGAWIKIQELP